MSEENLNNESSQEQQGAGEEQISPIEALKEMRKNYVPKTEYEKVVKEKNDYFRALVNGETREEDKVEPVDIIKLRKEMFNRDGNLTNLEFIEDAIKLREEVIDKEGKDIFCPYGKHISPDDSDYISAQQVADGFQHCIEVANGNPDIFRQELYRITVDSMPRRSAINNKIKR